LEGGGGVKLGDFEFYLLGDEFTLEVWKLCQLEFCGRYLGIRGRTMFLFSREGLAAVLPK
jgi:hypothetical protein